jgi:YXWGXW repeat-containing protein
MRCNIAHLRNFGASLALLAVLACAGSMSLGVVYTEPRPPPDRVDVVVAAPGREYVWIRGYWRWERNDYFWTPGHWQPLEPGYHKWVPGHWRQSRHRWYWIEGHWAR